MVHITNKTLYKNQMSTCWHSVGPNFIRITILQILKIQVQKKTVRND